MEKQIEFRTSGSTGTPKVIAKPEATLLADAAMLAQHFAAWFGDAEQLRVLSTISPEHMYGTLWLGYLMDLVKPAEVRRYFPEQEISGYTDAVRTAEEAMHIDTAGRNILVTHQFVTGALRSESEDISVGGSDNVDASVFDCFDYVALGHIHKPQDVNDRIRYCGTPMPYSFGKEETQVKSVTLLDTETMAQEIIPLPLLHKRTTFTGTYEELLNLNCPEEEKNGYVRLNVTDTAIGLELLSKLKQVYPHPMVVSGKVYEGDETTITLDANHEMAGKELNFKIELVEVK